MTLQDSIGKYRIGTANSSRARLDVRGASRAPIQAGLSRDDYRHADGTIARCYNSQATGSTQTHGSCGFSIDHGEVGLYGIVLDFRSATVSVLFDADEWQHPKQHRAQICCNTGSTVLNIMTFNTDTDPSDFGLLSSYSGGGHQWPDGIRMCLCCIDASGAKGRRKEANSREH